MQGYCNKKRWLALLLAGVCLTACTGEDRQAKERREQEERQLQEQLGQMMTDQPEWWVTPSLTLAAELDSPTEQPEAGPESGQQDDAKEVRDQPAVSEPEPITPTPEPELRKASFETNYGTSNAARAHNIERAAQLLNGVEIQPGEVFSCSQSIGPITEDNGYQPAGTYVAGKVEEGIGGGVCQISSTLYNAALLAGITIVERAPHSMVVSYVDPARDAAIAGDYKDLKLKNDFDAPVRIEANAAEGTLRFVLHTSEEADTEISLESVIVSETEPGEPVITVDETQNEDYYKVTQKAHTGYVAELYRIVSRDGEELSREKVNTSTYAAAPEYVTVGNRASE